MSWRTVVVSSRCKLDLKMGYMVIRSDSVKRIYLDEVAILIIENPAVSLTGNLLEALIEKKIKVVFCDGKRSPVSELMPYYGAHDSSRKMYLQLEWKRSLKALVWAEIIRNKIFLQAQHLSSVGKENEAALLLSYISQVESGDITNREGHAAKVYFNSLFGKDFSRREENPINSALNYGYGIILSAFNREIAIAGYLTQLGLHHVNVYNWYNLSSDLMEPYRILVDREVKHLNITEFDKEVKLTLVNILNKNVRIGGTKQTVLNSIRIYCKGIFDCLNSGEVTALNFYEL